MSCAVAPPLSTPVLPRKRTMSFSTPLPHKSARTPLRRTGSYLSLSDMQAAVETPLYGRRDLASQDCSLSVPYNRSLRYYKEQRERRKAPQARCPPIVFRDSCTATPATYQSSRRTMPRSRSSSPLAPTRTPLPERSSFPRSKPEPDLYRKAITTRMRLSPEGRKILHMGARLAISILTATRELEQIVAAQRESDSDVAMAREDVALSSSWVVVPPEDWEMVDCTS